MDVNIVRRTGCQGSQGRPAQEQQHAEQHGHPNSWLPYNAPKVPPELAEKDACCGRQGCSAFVTTWRIQEYNLVGRRLGFTATHLAGHRV